MAAEGGHLRGLARDLVVGGGEVVAEAGGVALGSVRAAAEIADGALGAVGGRAHVAGGGARCREVIADGAQRSHIHSCRRTPPRTPVSCTPRAPFDACPTPLAPTLCTPSHA